MQTIDWYFDYISPYAYLQSARLEAFAARGALTCQPVLFAGLLAHWGQKGPAEMSTKRRWTYEQIAWLAHRRGLALTFPASHPFVPLRLLRLSIALGNTLPVVRRLFAFVWAEGHLPTDEAAWQALLAEFGVAPDALEAPTVKDALRAGTQAAIDRGVFGVPTVAVGERLFWGDDGSDMALAWLDGDPWFQSPGFLAAGQVADGIQRRF
jgi:2-hydroxychromene-2-carboxylate isomerase